MNDKTTQKLAERAGKGNVHAYGKLIEQYQEYLYSMAFLHVKNQEDALDIVGECILNGFRRIHTLRQPEFFKTWITRILINEVKNHFRRQVLTCDFDQLEVADDQDRLAPEMRLDLYQAIDRLPTQYRSVVILKYFQDMKISEIAEVLEIPEGSAKAYLSRARAQLKNYLKEGYIDEI